MTLVVCANFCCGFVASGRQLALWNESMRVHMQPNWQFRQIGYAIFKLLHRHFSMRQQKVKEKSRLTCAPFAPLREFCKKVRRYYCCGRTIVAIVLLLRLYYCCSGTIVAVVQYVALRAHSFSVRDVLDQFQLRLLDRRFARRAFRI